MTSANTPGWGKPEQVKPEHATPEDVTPDFTTEVHRMRNMTSTQLVAHADMTMRRAHRSIVAVLEALSELERRSAYLDQGYSSMFDFCTRRWRFSPATSARYLAAARAAARFPQVREMLEDRRLTLCGVARIASALTPENSRELLGRAESKSFAEVEALIAGRREAPRVPDRIRVLGRAVRRAAGDSKSLALAIGGESRGAEDDGDDKGEVQRQVQDQGVCRTVCQTEVDTQGNGQRKGEGGSGLSVACDPTDDGSSAHDIQYGCDSPPAAAEPELRYEIRFVAGKQFLDKLERAKSICSSRADLEQILGRALDDLLERRDPERRARRRAERDRPKAIEAPSHDPSEPPADQEGTPARPHSRSRHIPTAVRDEVFRRDEGRCSYVSPAGVRCGARVFLQFDHLVRFARGGRHDVENLRLLCGKHNRRREHSEVCADTQAPTAEQILVERSGERVDRVRETAGCVGEWPGVGGRECDIGTPAATPGWEIVRRLTGRRLRSTLPSGLGKRVE
ncbi:MAG: HNH endonuclease [Candidatus Eisenbacteria bacterium]|uniref:HNH endonuclease n=1 Tax=Eiseniibacteriota bacterium TaxID=2212470 RepID=A0A956NE66_UNCEI|nr:HNH endonuclease [Candidatus Eisenbacteria bacterium]